MQGIALSMENGYNNRQLFTGGIGVVLEISERAG